MLDGLDRARVTRDSIAIIHGEIRVKVLQPLDERGAIRSSSSCARLFGVKNDRVERTGGGTIAFEQAPNVDALVFVRVERCRERFKRRVELVPFRGAFANLFAKVFGFQLISKLRLGGNMRVELLDKFASVVREVVEAFFLKVAKSSKR